MAAPRPATRGMLARLVPIVAFERVADRAIFNVAHTPSLFLLATWIVRLGYDDFFLHIFLHKGWHIIFQSKINLGWLRSM